MEEEKKKNTYTIVLMSSDSDTRIKKLKIHQNVLRLVLVLFIVFIAAAIFMLTNLFITRDRLNDKLTELERVTYRINYEKVEMVNLMNKSIDLETKTRILENYLKKVEQLDKTVRDITGE